MMSNSAAPGLCNYSDSDSDESNHHKDKSFKRIFNSSSSVPMLGGQTIVMRRDVVHSKQGHKVPVSILKTSRKKVLPTLNECQENKEIDKKDEISKKQDTIDRNEDYDQTTTKSNGIPVSFVINTNNNHDNSTNVLEKINKANNLNCTMFYFFRKNIPMLQWRI